MDTAVSANQHLESEILIDLTQRSPAQDDPTIVYAVGDIHGRLDLLDAMESMIAADIESSGNERPLICYLGDYIDRGPHSAQVLERLSAASVGRPSRVFLKGNHEDRMINFLVDPVTHGPGWMNFGGREALESYGVTPPLEIDAASLMDVRDRLDEAVPSSHKAFLDQLALSFRWRGYLLVHAGLNPERPVEAQAPRDLMWIREPFLSSTRDWGCKVVHGHVIVEEPVFRPNRIGIDTGAYASGRLTCLAISASGERVLQVAND